MKRPAIAISTITAFALAVLFATTAQATTYTFTPVNSPGAVGATAVNGIAGNTVFGDSFDYATGEHGFSYDGTIYKPIADPNGPTTPIAAFSNTIVGYYTDAGGQHGFSFNGSVYTTIDAPGTAYFCTANGIDGNNIVGTYQGLGTGFHGFIYNGTTYQTLDDPMATDLTAALGISGSQVVGYYTGTGGVSHGFVYSGSQYTTIDDPSATNGTRVLGISGETIVGCYFDAVGTHGFVYDGAAWTTVDYPSIASGTMITGISGTTLVGTFPGDQYLNQGFIASEVPEPVTAALLIPLTTLSLTRKRTIQQ